MQYEAPGSVEDAVALLAQANGEARVLAGGTDLLVQMRAGLVRPGLIVDVKKIFDMTLIAPDDGGFRIGAATCGERIGANNSLRAAWPGVVEAAKLIGSTQIQSRATIGGNLCNASPAADSVPAIIAAGGTCTVAGPDGRRDVAAGDIATGPGQTSLGKGEMVVDIRLPARPPRSGSAYLRFIPRTEMDIAVVGAGVCLSLDEGGVCTAARVTLGAVAPKVLVVEAAADALIGTPVDETALQALAAAASAACEPIDDIRGTVEFRTKVAGVLARRAAGIALERAGSN
ncbi:MAG: xanthine dehydrogenase family protein subunit M [Alphaproteobacteria bacterium]|nr:xanthine dehydrogenase family protein subunit M [Alphaproteobacteria bacterium]MDP6515369.1 xanthine dehydrogenase family protein subunit M [Alphaproteobacteria bacterium]